MDPKSMQEPEFVIILPAFLLVRAPENADPAEVVRKTLRLGSKGVETGRLWFVPIFTAEAVAARFAADVKKIDDKLCPVAITNPDDWATLLDTLLANGDRYVAFDPQPAHVQHVEIAGLVAGTRRKLRRQQIRIPRTDLVIREQVVVGYEVALPLDGPIHLSPEMADLGRRLLAALELAPEFVANGHPFASEPQCRP